ncbi:sialidase family protein [Parapedobacter tibetensis]|uniref:sialidase family protein n=1 Tax=Parapedobacter tibetensis TaxID=2972951 RepID=UPI00214D26E7|nr:sialidase family protein [Parapedobacter tibetensis]
MIQFLQIKQVVLKGLSCFTILFILSCSKEAGIDNVPESELQDDFSLEAGVLAAPQFHSHTVLFNGGTDGYHSYRIPALVRTTNGTLLAFAEGRVANNRDYGNINLVYKRSTNHGASWSSLKEVVGWGQGTWGNPTPVVDQNTGRVWLFMSWNDEFHNQNGNDGYDKIDSWGDRRVYMTYSDDHGLTWSPRQNMTSTLLPPGYAWDAMGPGNGIQKAKSPDNGALIIPATRRNIYSTDGGNTWAYQQIHGGTNEGAIVERDNGSLLRNDRPNSTQWNQHKRRWKASGSLSGGFNSFVHDATLLDPKCQASIIRYAGDRDRLIFLNPASTERRCKMRVRISYNSGATWPRSRRLHDWLTETETCNQGKGGYSSMTKTADYKIGALVEYNENVGNATSHRSIEFHRFNIPWILNGQSEP